MTAGAAPRHQVIDLARVFLARFFESESTAGRTDLRESFFWLIGALAAPGVFFAFYRQFYWQFALSGRDGAARLQATVLHDKTIYLTLTMVAIGLLTIVTRNALVVDRRDALVLGVLPVRPVTIVVSKLLALAGYVSSASLGMHIGAAALFGIFLGWIQPDGSLIRIALAHLIAAAAAGTFVFLSVVAFESVCVAAAGPRRFARVAPVVQALLLGGIVSLLFSTPLLAREASTVTEAIESTWWLALAPPIWFLGLYETLSRPSTAMAHLASTAWQSLAWTALLVLVFYPIASHRILRSAVRDGGSTSHRRRSAAGEAAIGLLARSPHGQAALQFLTATTTRVGRFRLTMAAAVGLGLTPVVPLVVFWAVTGLPSEPSWSLLAAPLLLSAPVVGGWRAVVSMPSELNARWVFLAAPFPSLAGRLAVVRMAAITGVLLPLACVVPLWLAMWGLAVSAPLVANALLAGGILVSVHFWGFTGVPCTRPLAVSDANLQGRWPFYLLGVLAYAVVLPALEVLASGHVVSWLLTISLLVGWLVVRTMSAGAAHVNVLTDGHRGFIQLDLGIVSRSPPVGRPVEPSTVIPEAPHA